MSKNFTIAEMKNGKATITQNERVHFCTYDAMCKAVEEVDGKIGKNKEGMIKATVASKKIAEACVRKVERGLAKARKNKATAESEVKTDKATSRTNKNAPAPAKGKASSGKIFTDENGKKWTFDTKGNFVPVGEPAKKDAPKHAKGADKTEPKVVKHTKAEKKAIRSECMKQANGDRAKYDKLCKARGVDNGR